MPDQRTIPVSGLNAQLSQDSKSESKKRTPTGLDTINCRSRQLRVVFLGLLLLDAEYRKSC
jgi:hypothetical protein